MKLALTSLISNIPSLIFGIIAFFMIYRGLPFWWIFILLSVFQITSIKKIREYKDNKK